MFLTVGIPVYNKEKYVSEAIESVLSQSFTDYELILWDDGSTDGSGAICDDFASKFPDKIRVFHDENRGAYSARHSIQKNAVGDFIYIMDADDYIIDSHFIETVYNKIASEDADLLMFPASNKASKLYRIGMTKTEILDIVLKSDAWNNMWTKVYRRDLSDYWAGRIRRTPILLGEDLLQFLNIFCAASKIVLLDKLYYFYRSTEGGGVSSFNIKQFDSVDIIHDKLLECLDVFNCSDQIHVDRVRAKTLARIAAVVRKIKYAKGYGYRELKQYMAMIRDSSVFRQTYEQRFHIPLDKRTVAWCLHHGCFFVLWMAFKVMKF